MKAKGIEYLQFSPKVLTSSAITDRLPVRSHQYRERHKLVLNLRSQEAKRDVISSELARSFARSAPEIPLLYWQSRRRKTEGRLFVK